MKALSYITREAGRTFGRCMVNNMISDKTLSIIII